MFIERLGFVLIEILWNGEILRELLLVTGISLRVFKAWKGNSGIKRCKKPEDAPRVAPPRIHLLC